ncbi:unnamed protein product, partial [Ectocarpus sp. 12 AP-2014]
ITFAIFYGAGAFLAAFLALKFVRSRRTVGTKRNGLVFLIKHGRLADANPAGQKMLDAIDGPTDPLAKLHTYLRTRFESTPNLGSALPLATEKYTSIDGKTTMLVEGSASTLRLQLSSNEQENTIADVHSLSALKSELSTLRANARAAPFLLWRETTVGEITWVNKAYLDAVGAAFGEKKKTNWPLPSLFPTLQASVNKSSRLALRNIDKTETWYDCHVSSVGS